jgi:hypothetical protein
VRARIDTRGPEIAAVANGDAVPVLSETVGLRFRRDRLHLFKADDGKRVA